MNAGSMPYSRVRSPILMRRSFKHGRHVRVWKIDAKTGAVAAQFLYPLDEPASFQRDQEAGEVELTDIKVSEAAAIGLDRLLVLERISPNHEGLLCAVGPAPRCRRRRTWTAGPGPRSNSRAPQVSAIDNVPVLAKTLVLSTDDAPELDRDLEGMVVLSPHELLLVNDNDFSVEGARTRFWRIRLKKPMF